MSLGARPKYRYVNISIYIYICVWVQMPLHTPQINPAYRLAPLPRPTAQPGRVSRQYTYTYRYTHANTHTHTHTQTYMYKRKTSISLCPPPPATKGSEEPSLVLPPKLGFRASCAFPGRGSSQVLVTSTAADILRRSVRPMAVTWRNRICRGSERPGQTCGRDPLFALVPIHWPD